VTAADLEAEQEVDFRRYGSVLAARWWLPVAGLVLGLLVGYVLSVGGGSVWKAQALISLGQPFSPGGGSPVTSFATNPRAVAEIIRSEAALKEAARTSGMRPSNLRGHVSSGQVGVGTGAGAARSVTLMQLTVQGPKPAKVEKAANALARIVVDTTTEKYVGTKIAALQQQRNSLTGRIATQAEAVNLLRQQANNRSLPPLDRLALVTQLNGGVQLLGQLQDQIATLKQQLALAETVESATIVQTAAAVKSTARSKRSSMLVAGLIGLLLGALAALLWEPVTRRTASSR
jgi:uncharacterized protein involved in exopolysaccharide biosynthesis